MAAYNNASTVELLMAALPTPADLRVHLASITFDQQKTRIVTYSIFTTLFSLSTLWKLFIVVLFIGNLKNIPGIYHLRLLNAFRFVIRTCRSDVPLTPDHLFQPLITSSKATLMETDLYMHKSNSTYFSDVDIARAHLICTLFSTSIEKMRGGTSGVVNGKVSSFICALGAVSCTFRRELKPYEEYDMWTRVLAWDEKWLYIVTHFVKKGAKIQPNEMTLYKRQNSTVASSATSSPTDSPRGSIAGLDESFPRGSVESRSAVAASALSKVVFKNGRITISPEVMLQNSGLLPPRPTKSTAQPHDRPVIEKPVFVSSPFKATQTVVDDAESSDSDVDSQSSRRSSTIPTDPTLLEQWAWDRIESERQRGLKVAQALSVQQNVIENELNDTEALGRHTDGAGIAGVMLTLAQLGKMSNYSFL